MSGSAAPEGEFSYHADHLGSVRFLTDEAGEVVNEYDYDAYGQPEIIQESVAQPFLYTGREWETDSAVYQYRARAYDPTTGRFLQEAPIWFAAGDLNVHRYVGNNPVNFVDPSGMTAASQAATTASNAAKAAPTLQRVGLAAECLFGSIAAASFLVTEGVSRVGLDRISRSAGDCGAVGKASRTARVARANLRRAICRKATPQTAARKGRLVQELFEVVIEEVVNVTLQGQVIFDADTDRLISDFTVNEDRQQRIELKGGNRSSSVRISGRQRQKYTSRSGQTLAVQLVCPGGRRRR